MKFKADYILLLTAKPWYMMYFTFFSWKGWIFLDDRGVSCHIIILPTIDYIAINDRRALIITDEWRLGIGPYCRHTSRSAFLDYTSHCCRWKFGLPHILRWWWYRWSSSQNFLVKVTFVDQLELQAKFLFPLAEGDYTWANIKSTGFLSVAWWVLRDQTPFWLSQKILYVPYAMVRSLQIWTRQ